MELRYPFNGLFLVILPCIWAGLSTYILPHTWDAETQLQAWKSIRAFLVLYVPKILLYWMILPLEGTPFVLLLLESGFVMIISYFTMFKRPMPSTTELKAKRKSIEYLKLRHEDSKTSLTVAVGSGFSIILTLLIGAVTFFYSEVLRFGLEDPRGRFPYFQTLTIVVLAAVIMMEWAYELVYRFYREMTECTKALWEII